MDDVYDNLDNYNEESTIAELREENNNLKLTLEEYADKLDKLQKEFDMLTSEHKKLEMNYSSLLKTARSEIERKTQLITKLNIEKDEMVLSSVQNRNKLNNQRRTPIRPPIKNQEETRNSRSNPTRFSGDNSVRPHPNQGPKERREDSSNHLSNTNTPTNIQTRLLDIVNNTGNPDLKGARQNTIKENIKLKDDSETARVRITCRRKSMPVFSVEKFSSDEDELISTGSAKELNTKEQPERHLDQWGPTIDKRNLEDKTSGHKFNSRSRHSPYDKEKYRSRDRHEPFLKHKKHYSPDQSRKIHDRKNGSPDRRRGSPNRNTRDTHNHTQEVYKRKEYDRRRRLVSPSKDKHCHDFKQRNRHSPRSCERNDSLQDRYKSRNQDIHAMKHKLPPDYDQSSKRMRLDPIPKHDEERSRIERQVGHIPLDLDMHSISCQSPDQTHFEGHQSQQTREIKLNALAKLDDPRLLSQKYTLKTHDGKTELSTVESANIDVKVVDTSNWEMTKTVKMPDALLKKPITLDIPTGLFQKRVTSAMPDASLRKANSSMLEASSLIQNSPGFMSAAEIQKPSSAKSNKFQNAIATDIPKTALQKPSFHDDNSSISPTQRPMSTDMPDILIQKSSEEVKSVASTENTSTDDPVREIYMDIETPISNISMEPGEIYDFQNDFHGPEEDTNKLNTQDTKTHVTKSQNIEISHQKPSHYKKSKTILEETPNTKIRKSILPIDVHNDEQKSNPKLNSTDNINNSNKVIDDKVDKKYTEIQKSELPNIGRKGVPCEYQDYVTAKEMIEDDLELSDENSDNNDVQITKQTWISDNKQDSAKTDFNLTSKTPESINQLTFDFNEPSTRNIEEQNSKHIEPIVIDTNKHKARKKSLKLKETNEPQLNKDSAVCMDKPVNKKESTNNEPFENTDTSLSIERLVTINENIKQLSEELPLSIAKTVKKKDNKSKLPSKNKDAKFTNDKPPKKKDAPSKDLSENKDTVPTGKPVNKKENNPKQQLNKKETAAVDKSAKKKENKTKESLEPKNTLPLEKPAKRKKNKTESSESKERAVKPTEKSDKVNEPKTKGSKYSELFEDSSSLVSPEDLGLVPTVVPQENYVALFEDALYATDVSAGILPTEKTNDILRKDPTTSKFGLDTINIATPAIDVEPNTQKPAYMATKEAESTINLTLYQNLQPQISPKDNETVKTVIISSGTQPQPVVDATMKYHFENDRTNSDLYVMQCVKPTVIHDSALQALATSTPQKVWQQSAVQAGIDQKLTSLGYSNESPEASINKTPAIVHSDTTNNSQKHKGDEPDMTIFVKRRRKVAKKK